MEEADVEKILDWSKTAGNVEIPFKPARVILQDFTYVFTKNTKCCMTYIYLFFSGVPCVVDLAAMRDAMQV